MSFHSPSCLCNACIVGVNAHGFFKSGGSGNLWCIFSIFPVTFFFPPTPPSVSLPTMHRFTCKLLSVVCGECTKFKHINKHFNFQSVSSRYSRARSISLSSHRGLAKPVEILPRLFVHIAPARRNVMTLRTLSCAQRLWWWSRIMLTFTERRRN